MTVRILVGDCLDALVTLSAESVQTCVTSPPYWGLRDYGHEQQLGSERTYVEYVANMRRVFAEVRRVLADDGTLWLNLGDCYATGAGKVGEHPGGGEQGERWRGGHEGKHRRANGVPVGHMTQPNRLPQPDLKAKDLVGIPWRVALALQEDGWYLRSDIIWSKPNPMPESVTDRPTKAHEYLFLLSKSERYLYDAAAIAEPAVSADEAKWDPGTDGLSGADRKTGATTRRFKRRTVRDGIDTNGGGQGTGVMSYPLDTRNKRTVWTVPSQPFSGAHFATFPPALIEPCILAGSRVGDTVLDPFGGAGTTGLVADRLSRNALLIELNPEYAELARTRIHDDSPLFSTVADAVE